MRSPVQIDVHAPVPVRGGTRRLLKSSCILHAPAPFPKRAVRQITSALPSQTHRESRAKRSLVRRKSSSPASLHSVLRSHIAQAVRSRRSPHPFLHRLHESPSESATRPLHECRPATPSPAFYDGSATIVLGKK